MGLIKDLIPVNLEEEKRKFFASGGTYNPQFRYSRIFSEKVLGKYGLPRVELVELARKELEKLPEGYFCRQNETIGGQSAQNETILTQKEVEKRVREYVRGLDLPELRVEFASGAGNRAMISDDLLTFRWSDKLSEKELKRILDHEVGVHHRRNVAHKRNFRNVVKKTLTKEQRETEEGLAIYYADRQSGGAGGLNSAYLKYVLVAEAQKGSFVETYEAAMKYLQNEERAFNWTIREKRGLEDTSQAGGFSKDLVYLEGYLVVKEWVEEGGEIEKLLEVGKVSLREMKEIMETA